MKREWQLVNECKICGDNEESTNRILIHCKFVSRNLCASPVSICLDILRFIEKSPPIVESLRGLTRRDVLFGIWFLFAYYGVFGTVMREPLKWKSFQLQIEGSLGLDTVLVVYRLHRVGAWSSPLLSFLDTLCCVNCALWV